MTDEKTEPRTLRPDFWLMLFDQTSGWEFPEEQKKHIKRIVRVALVDRNEVTYLCELTPSYCFYPVETRAEYQDYIYEENPENEKIRDLIDEVIQKEQDSNCFYHHCKYITPVLETADKAKVYHYGDTNLPFDDSSYDEQVESLLDHFRGNQCL